MRIATASLLIFCCVVVPASAGPVELRGAELEAFTVALRDFRQHRFSASNDLSHYKITFERQRGAVEIVFLPDQPERYAPGEAGTGSGTKYGECITYLVSLKRPHILRRTFAR